MGSAELFSILRQKESLSVQSVGAASSTPAAAGGETGQRCRQTDQPAKVFGEQEPGKPGVDPNPVLVRLGFHMNGRKDRGTDPQDQQPSGGQPCCQSADQQFPAPPGAGRFGSRGRKDGIVQQQGIGGYAKQLADPHHMLSIRCGSALLPFGQSLPGDADLPSQLFLGPVLFLSS